MCTQGACRPTAFILLNLQQNICVLPYYRPYCSVGDLWSTSSCLNNDSRYRRQLCRNGVGAWNAGKQSEDNLPVMSSRPAAAALQRLAAPLAVKSLLSYSVKFFDDTLLTVGYNAGSKTGNSGISIARACAAFGGVVKCSASVAGVSANCCYLISTAEAQLLLMPIK